MRLWEPRFRKSGEKRVEEGVSGWGGVGCGLWGSDEDA